MKRSTDRILLSPDKARSDRASNAIETASPESAPATLGDASLVVRRAIAGSAALSGSDVMQLQSLIGNRAVTRLLARRKPAHNTAGGNDAARSPAGATGLPDNLKAGIENLSGMPMDDVRAHYRSPEPARVQALAYAQGTEIHLGPGQEQHLPHEAWHVVQQKQGRVRPTLQSKRVSINDDTALEREATTMGDRAIGAAGHPPQPSEPAAVSAGERPAGAHRYSLQMKKRADETPSAIMQLKKRKKEDLDAATNPLFEEHAAKRAEWGMPAAGEPNDGCVVRLDAGGNTYWGHNAHGLPLPPGMKANAISKTHAEGHVMIQAWEDRPVLEGAAGEVVSDRALCGSCGAVAHGLAGMAKSVGLGSLEVTSTKKSDVQFGY
ncbi:MAG: DUF4157 domain-containing protein [Phycisphaerales bacterium]|nr:MAG: DUF4157 domain-containing protein [Phycisphaerales bacterium]